jgi:branched-chain amino acid transport system ATP-binding protein
MSAAAAAPQASAIAVARPQPLRLQDVHKHYGGLHAVDGVTAEAVPGQVLGIAGPNGAGKTTLFDVITGLTPSSGGEVLLGDARVDALSIPQRCHAGMARTFQTPTVAGTLTVYENILVAARFGGGAGRWHGLDEKPEAVAEWALAWSGMADQGDDSAELLGVFDKKRLMIATALAMRPLVLLLDEPFGGLNPDEIDRTLELVRGVAAFGVTVVCIEHVMRALVQLAQRVVVMHHGRVFFEGTPDAMMRDQKVIEVYLGEKAARRAQG